MKKIRKRRSILGIFWRALCLALLLLVLGAGVLAGWLRWSVPTIDGTITLDGPAAPIEILRDAWGIPHILAETPEDAYFGLGFAHAQDRLFQMEQQRRLAQGRLSEVLGSSTLAFDRFLRTLGLYRAAEESVAALDPETLAALEAYAAGVNAYIASHEGALAPEFALLLADDPEPWRPADSVAWLKVMALHLSGNWREEALRAGLVDLLGAERAASFFPAHPADATVILDAARLPAGDWPQSLLDLLPQSGNGSNNWVIDGRHTASGLPMLANDPHLGFSMPAVWYLAHLDAPGLTVAGATLPGIPMIVVGTNGRIAWGVTNTGPDTQDLFLERPDPDDPARYLTPEGSAPFERHEETIAVRFGEDVNFTAQATRHGPVISGIREEAEGLGEDEADLVALFWTLLNGDDRTMDAGMALHTAGNWPDFMAAARLYDGPQQNIVFADRRGNIGMVAPALIPARAGGEGLVPSRGWTGEGDWTAFVPFEDLPRLRNPASGTIATANERLVGDDYPWFLGNDWQPGYRGDRIHQLLAARNDHDIASFRAIQNDTVSLFALEMLPVAMAGTPLTDAGRALKARLAGWEGDMAADAIAPTVFEAWYRELTRSIYADETGPLFQDAWWFRTIFVRAVLAGEAGPWCDDINTGDTESCDDLIGQAFDRAAAFLEVGYGPDPEAWRWGKVHAIHLNHRLYGMIPGIARLTGLDLETGGGRFTVAAGGYVYNDDARVFENVHGPVLRAIVALGDPEGARFVILPGQSGNPFSPFWDNMAARWLAADPIPIALDRDGIEAVYRLLLEPAPAP
ncbi:MAG: penicillin acylase family protein [Proteobacteria bacterium]|nr:penicillin acylase family protein [Pseudomonadota bacterium]